jgi:hypothetical protein
MRSCIQEISILLLADVIDETLAALATGKHYDDKGQIRGEFADLHAYKEKSHRHDIGEIHRHLQGLQWLVREFDGFLRNCPGTNYPTREFVSAGLPKRIDASLWQEILRRCDQIDISRNSIVGLVNNMLSRCSEHPLPLIRLSSTLLPVRD